MSEGETIRNRAASIWSVADLLRGDHKPSEYGKDILPLRIIRRLDSDSSRPYWGRSSSTREACGVDRGGRAINRGPGSALCEPITTIDPRWARA
jgi:hypothetical protein